MALDAVIRETAYGRQLERRPTIDSASRDALEELADGVFLDRIPRGEREILIDAIMPQTPETEQERSRAQKARNRRRATFSMRRATFRAIYPKPLSPFSTTGSNISFAT
jgi:hypothetical protein